MIFTLQNLLPVFRSHAFKKVVAAAVGIAVAAPLVFIPATAPWSGAVAAATAQATDNVLEGQPTVANVGAAAAEGAVATLAAGAAALPLAPFMPDAAKAIQRGAEKVEGAIESLPPDWPKLLVDQAKVQPAQPSETKGMTKALAF